MVQRLEETFNTCADLVREILQQLRLRDGRVRISLCRDGSVRVEKEEMS